MTPSSTPDPAPPSPPPPESETPALPALSPALVKLRAWGRLGLLLLGLVIVATAAAGGGIWWWKRPTPHVPPTMPNVADSEVQAAIESARQRVLDKPFDADAWGFLGMTLYGNSFEAEADTCFAEAARLDPKSPKWPYGRALVIIRRDPAAAVPFLRETLAQISPVDDPYPYSSVRCRLAEALLEQGQLDEAEQLFTLEQELNPQNPRPALGLGLIALAHNRPEEAEAQLTKAKTVPFARKTALVQLASLALARGDKKTSEEYEKMAETLPEDAPWQDPFLDEAFRLRTGFQARLQQAERLEREQRYDEAAEIFLKVVHEKPTTQACVGAGINLIKIGDFDRGLPILREAVKLGPEYSFAHYSLAFGLFTLGEKEWQRAPKSSRARKLLLECVEEARRTTELNPVHAPAYLYWGRALLYLGEPAAAVEPLKKGVSCLPSDANLRLALGEALLASGQEVEAEDQFKVARDLSPKDPRVEKAFEQLRMKKSWWRRTSDGFK